MSQVIRATSHGTRREDHDTAAVESDLLSTLDPLGRGGRLWIVGLLAVMSVGATAWIMQLVNGLRVTEMRNYVSWGTYMANFVFFIGISHAGTLISAILRVTDAGWRRPITRMAEAITVFALMVGAPMVLIDMGRPDRLLNVFIHGRLQSPILWDVVSITTYLTGSMLYLYVAMIPDMPILARHARERGRSPRLVRFYEAMSLGYRESAEHRRRLAIALGAMAAIIIPVAISVHTVVSWVFGMTLRPGWHSTIFGPYFVVGAIFSGTAAIITAMVIFRRAYRLERYLLPLHFRNLGKILLVLTLLYAYFTLSEYLTAWYGGLEADRRLMELLAGHTAYGLSFWLWVVIGLFAPIGFLLFPGRRSISSIVTASVLVNVGMWVKRYLIVIPTLQTPFIPAEAAGVSTWYFPSPVEWAITAGAFAAFLLLFTLFSRLFPILSIWETAEDVAETKARAMEAPTMTRQQPVSPLPATLWLALFVAGCTLLTPLFPTNSARAQGAAQIEEGRAVYRRNCRTCHGATGEPSAETKRKYSTIPTLSDSAFLAGLSDDSMLVVLRNGKGKDMKSWSDILTEAEMAAVVSFIRTLPQAQSRDAAPVAAERPPRNIDSIPPSPADTSRAALTAPTLPAAPTPAAPTPAAPTPATPTPATPTPAAPTPATPTPATPTTVVAPTLVTGAEPGRDWVAPARQARRTNPIPESPEVAARGREIFRQECASCHGRLGHGDGPRAANLDTKVSNLTTSAVQAQSDGTLFWKITEGRGDMPSTRADLTDEERWIVVHHMRSLGGRPTGRAPVGGTGAHAPPAALPGAPIAGELGTSTAASAGSLGLAAGDARIELGRATEGDEEMLVASVTIGGQPAAGITVGFFAPRHFGLLPLGESETFDDGTAAVSFPLTLPGDLRGDVRFRVALLAPDAVKGAQAEAVLSGSVPLRQEISVFPRALWSTRAPIGLLAGITLLLLCVWSTYAFTVWQLLKLRGLAADRHTPAGDLARGWPNTAARWPARSRK
ncbi:MAG: NrfD/PsrC family molybdoenzyme membrane anchor subunit [Gemmatimonadaceae bacterium]